MVDSRRLLINLFFFLVGLVVPLLLLQPAFAYDSCVQAHNGSFSGDLYPVRFTMSNQLTQEWQSGSTGFVYTGSGNYPLQHYDGSTQTAWSGVGYDGVPGSCAERFPELTEVTVYPPPQVPEHCSNGALDGDETGFDCGGSCPDVCGSETCPDGYIPLIADGDITGCAREGTADKFGNCGGDFFFDSTIGKCVSLTQVTDPITYGESYQPPELDPVPFGQTGTFSVTHFVDAETVVDNGDGTETATITYSSTDSDGNTTTGSTSVDRPSGSAAGTGFTTGGGGSSPVGVESGYSGQTTTDQDISEEENPENYDYQLEDGEYDGEISQDDIPETANITDLVQGFINDNPVATTITGSGIDLDSSATQLSWVYPPTGQEIVFDLTDRGGVLAGMGFLLVFLSGISAYYIIVGRQ